MKIISLYIEEFGGLRDRRIELDEGLNIVEGDNESGKSTVWLFIKFMLYGMPRKTHEDYIRSVSRSGRCAKGTMTLSFEGTQYRVERSFAEGRRLGVETSHIYRLPDHFELFVGTDAGEAFLGVPREVFESSCGVGQMKCDGVGDKKGVDAIRNLLSSGDESADITKIESKLDKIRITYRYKTGKGGKLYDLGERAAQERVNLERALNNEQRKRALQERLERIEEQMAQNEKRSERVHQLLTQMGKLGLIRRFETLRRNEEELRVLETDMDTLCAQARCADAMPTEADVAILRAQADALAEAEERVATAKQKRERIEPLSEDEEQDAALGERLEADGGYAVINKRYRSMTAMQIFWAIAATVCCGVAFVCVFQTAFSWLRIASAVPWLVTLTGIVLPICYGIKKDRIISPYGISHAEISCLAQYAEALARKREYNESVRLADTELAMSIEAEAPIRERLTQTLLRTAAPQDSVGSLSDQAYAESMRLERFLQRYSQCEKQCNALRLMIRSEREALSAHDETALRAQVSQEVLNATDSDVQRAEDEQRFYAGQRRTMEQTRYQTQLELANLNAETAPPTQIADRHATLTHQLDRAEEYYESLTMAIDALKAAAESMSGSLTPRLSKDAGMVMEYISAGKYTSLQTGNTLSPSIFGEDGLSVSPELMSGGTRDAAYLSLRIALLMHVFEKELPPLMLDESLCAMDDGRMGRILSFLGKMTERRLQCLLFTCHKREAAYCETAQIPCHRIFL